ncbi:MAG: methyltransferase domain-containing protein [Candidatus Nealsonbacteria bacterium]
MKEDYKKDWKEEWNRIALDSDKDYELISTNQVFLNENKRLIFDFLKDFSKNPHIRILDIGCGPGIYTNILQKMGYKNIHGIDFSEPMIEKARKLTSKDIDYKVGDVTSLPYNNNFFSLVICFGMLQYLNKKEDQITTLKEIARVLNKRGTLLFTTLNKFSLKNIFPKKERKIQPIRYNPFQLRKDLKKIGFEKIKLKGIYVLPLPFNISGFLHKTRVCNFLDILFRVTNPLSHSFYIQAEKYVS